jgi:hypothetical protein
LLSRSHDLDQQPVQVAEFGGTGDFGFLHARTDRREQFGDGFIVEGGGYAEVVDTWMLSRGRLQEPDAGFAGLEPDPVVVAAGDRAEDFFVKRGRFLGV